jgi:hypothetical protein
VRASARLCDSSVEMDVGCSAERVVSERDDPVGGEDRPRQEQRQGRWQEQGRAAADGESSLRAALLALGIGVIWAALSHRRRRRPTDLW